MRSHGQLFERVTAFDNLFAAARKAARGKRWRPDVLAFNAQLEVELCRMREELRTWRWRPGPYRRFTVCDGKRRLVSAAPFRDRVVHHAIGNVIEPIFDRAFIHDTYASRAWKGTHAALDRYTEFARRHRYVLLCDIRRYFPSIDREILKAKVARRVACRPTRQLIDLVIDTAPQSEVDPVWFLGDTLLTPLDRSRGLPVGNQTSQLFGNVYLDAFDHFVKERLRCKAYVRYVDDFVVLDDDAGRLRDVRSAVAERLCTDRLQLHPGRQHISRTADGIRFLGFRVWPDRRRVSRESVVRFRRRLKQLHRAFDRGEHDIQAVHQAVAGWIGHVRHADSWGLRRAVLGTHVFECRLAVSDAYPRMAE